jgi:tRNA A37 threonylcarbamoyladenosine biosynthesis protein TsaE
MQLCQLPVLGPSLLAEPFYNPLRPPLYDAELPLLHYDVGNLSRPSDADCEMIAGTFPGCVSVIEWAEQLREWGAAPEQRLAIYFRRLPAVRLRHRRDGRGGGGGVRG